MSRRERHVPQARPLPSLARLQKAAKRIIDPTAGRAKILGEGACRACGRRLPPRMLERHHLVPRSLGGDDVDANLIPLGCDFACGCHGRFERGPGRRVVASLIRRSLTVSEVEYIASRKGPAWIDTYYPEEP